MNILNRIDEIYTDNTEFGYRYIYHQLKVMVFERSESVTKCCVAVSNEILEQVTECVYLGCMFSCDGRMDKEIDRRVSAGCKILGAMGKFTRDVNLSAAAKIAVYKSVLVPTLMYGSECWAWKKKHKSRLTAVEMRYLRGVCGYSRRDHVRNMLAYDECMIDKSLIRRIDAGQLRWFGHVERMSNDRLVKVVYDREVDGVRLRGRPRLVWLDMIESVLKERKVRSLNVRRSCLILIGIEAIYPHQKKVTTIKDSEHRIYSYLLDKYWTKSGKIKNVYVPSANEVWSGDITYIFAPKTDLCI